MKDKIIGIYKIISPSGKIYIGQTKDLKQRFNYYSRLKCKSQYKLYNSLAKYGPSTHIFDLIEECDINQLSIRERYWQDFYDVLGPNGLNLILTPTDYQPMVMSQEVKDKIGDANRGNQNWLNKNHTEETKKKMSDNRKGKKCTPKATEQNRKNAKNNAKVVLDTQTGIFFNGAVEAAETYNITYSYLRKMLNGGCKNKTNLIYV